MHPWTRKLVVLHISRYLIQRWYKRASTALWSNESIVGTRYRIVDSSPWARSSEWRHLPAKTTERDYREYRGPLDKVGIARRRETNEPTRTKTRIDGRTKFYLDKIYSLTKKRSRDAYESGTAGKGLDSIFPHDKFNLAAHVLVVNSLAFLVIDSSSDLGWLLIESAYSVLIEDTFATENSVEHSTGSVDVALANKNRSCDKSCVSKAHLQRE